MSTAVSIIIPTRNDERTLPQTVASVLAQDYSDFEVIIVNDGGADPSTMLSLDDPRLQVITLPAHSGVSAARNAGFRAAQGDFVFFLDADDLVASDLLSYMRSSHAQMPFDVFACGFAPVKDSQIAASLDLLAPRLRTAPPVRLSALDIFEGKRAGRMLRPSCVIYARRFLQDLLGEAPWREELRNAADMLIVMQACTATSVLYTPEILSLYRLREGSLSGNLLRNWNARRQAMDILLPWLIARSADPELVGICRHLRQNAARRAARIYRIQGQRQEARNVLLNDLRTSFNLKSLAELVRT